MLFEGAQWNQDVDVARRQERANARACQPVEP